jgi:hypothetical protein
MIGTTSFRREVALAAAAARALRAGADFMTPARARYYRLGAAAARAKRVRLARIDAVEAERARTPKKSAAEQDREYVEMGRRLRAFHARRPQSHGW